MNILLSINASYINIAEVLIHSILLNNKDENINFYIFHNDIGIDEQNEMVLNFSNYANPMFFFYRIDESSESFKTVNKIGSSRWPKMVYYRLLAPYILSQELDRILYLDADMIVNGSLTELYNIEFLDNLAVMCEDTMVMDRVEFTKRLGLPDYSLYYNSGMILMNLDGIRRKFKRDEIYKLFDKYYDYLLFPDQDILNIMFNKNCITADYRKFNFICSYQRESKELLQLHSKNAVIYHFAGGKYHKPWEPNYIGDYFEIYWKYGIYVFGSDMKRKCRVGSRYLKMLHLIEKRIDLFLEFHTRKQAL